MFDNLLVNYFFKMWLFKILPPEWVVWGVEVMFSFKNIEEEISLQG